MKIPKKMQEFFKSVPIMAFATANKNGKPNVVAIASMKIVDKSKLWIIDTYFKKTKQNIIKNNKVSVSMWKKGKGYQFKGEATYYSKGKIFEKAKEWILKIKPKKIVKGVVQVQIKEIYSITPNYEMAGKKLC